MNIFGFVLTNEAPSANHRRENDENALRLQTIEKGGDTYSMISSVSIRNRLRDTMAEMGLEINRSRFIHPTNPQPMVVYKDNVNPEKYLDDFVFGYVRPKNTYLADGFGCNLKSSFLVNHAMSLFPFRNDTLLQQYPKQLFQQELELLKIKKSKKDEGDESDEKSGGLLNVETHYTSYQFPFGLEKIEKWNNSEWVSGILKGIGQLGFVAGNHARTMFDFSPKSIIVRVTKAPAPQFDLYGFNVDGSFKNLIKIINTFGASDFWIGGDIINSIDFKKIGCNVYESCPELLENLGAFSCKIR